MKNMSSTKLLLKLQFLLIKFIKDNELFRVKEFMNDNIVVYSFNTHKIIKEQEIAYKRIKKRHKKMIKYKKGLFDIEIDEEIALAVKDVLENNIENQEFLESIQDNLNDAKNQNLKNFKNDIERISGFPSYTHKKISFSRNLSPCNSHVQFLSKINELIYEPKKITGTLINQSTVFQNGIPVSQGTNSQDKNDDVVEKKEEENFSLFFNSE